MEFIEAKQIISSYSRQNSWFGNNYNMNIYKGCSHGCIYCDSRSDCYRIENFDQVKVKRNAIEIINNQLKTLRKKGVIGTGSMSDPYNFVERELSLTRQALELVDKYGFGISIATKSSLIARDIDVLTNIASHSPVLALMTITTHDDQVSKIVEPNVCLSSQRFETLKFLSSHGIKTGILLMPVLPFITDSVSNIKKIVNIAKAAGVSYIYPAFGVTLRQNQRVHFYQKLYESFGEEVKQNYITTFGNSYVCRSPRENELLQAFKRECQNAKLLYQMEDIIRDYKKDYLNEQMKIF